MARRRLSSGMIQPASPPAKRARTQAAQQDDTTAKSSPAPPPPRRSNPRRSVADRSVAVTAMQAIEEAASAAVPPPDVIHDRVFAPVTAEERDAWKGWTDIESEPAFFNFILCELGIRGAKIQEVFSVDEASPEYLPNPAGLIFLYRFVEEDENEIRQDCPDDLWFANQTTSNACATIAMLNIAMNCPGLRLGDALTRFKAATQHLHPALRGHLLSSDVFIRSKHNSFARRLDMLASDNTLRHEYLDAQKKKKTTKVRASSALKADKAAAVAVDEAAFHFIAYVPMGQDVWELNGMQEKGLRLAPVDTNTTHWTATARERIAERMLAYAQHDDRAVFSLLALCQTDDEDDDDDDIVRAAARLRDYTPAVHCWIKKLADKGVLRQLATGQTDEET